jgi:hypothetical protein
MSAAAVLGAGRRTEEMFLTLAEGILRDVKQFDAVREASSRRERSGSRGNGWNVDDLFLEVDPESLLDPFLQ